MNIDSAILEQCLKRDEKACYQLYKIMYGYLLSICWRYARDETEAKSLLNTSFSKIIFQLNKYDQRFAFKSWARRLTINHIIDEMRKKKTYEQHILQWDRANGEEARITRNQGEETLNYDDLIKLLKHLPGATRDVFNLFVIDEYSHKEISGMLNISIGTSKWHVAQARKFLQPMVEKRYEAKKEGKKPIVYLKSQES